MICYLHILSLYSQDTVNDFNTSILKVCKSSHHEVLFHKSAHYFLNDKIDATYINISKYLLENKKASLSDYAYYLQGACALDKSLWNQAKESFNKISDTFRFNDLKKLKFAGLYMHQKEYKKSLLFYNQWEVTQPEPSKSYDLKIIYHNIGVCHLHLGNYTKAANYLNKELDLAVKSKDTLSVIYATMDIANLYYEQYQDTKAIPLFEKAYALSKMTSDFEIKKLTAINMAVVSENQNKLKVSIAYRKEYEKWKDSIWNRDKIWELAKQEKTFVVAQKEKEIELQEKQIDVQKARQNLLFIGIISLLIIIGVIAFFLRHRIKKNKVITVQKSELSDLNEMKNKLFSIVSHDLRTPINTIRQNNRLLKEAFENNDQKEVSIKINESMQVANEVYLLVDKVLNWSLLESGQLFSSIEPFPLKPIIAQVIYNYKSIINSKNIQITNNIPANIIVYSDIESTKVVIRNLLDNAVKYSNQKGLITFEVTDKNSNFCNLKITDTGTGITEEKLKSIMSDHKTKISSQSAVSGFGLRLCKSLLHNIGGDLKISSTKDIGTTLNVILPLKKQA